MIDLSFDALRASGAIPHGFGLGFIQLRLNPKQRMQFWHPAFQSKAAEGEIHDTPYSFCAQIMVGELIHETWRYEPNGHGQAECLELGCGSKAAGHPTPISTGALTLSGRYTMATGSKFFFPASDFHRTITRRAVLLLCRGATENARVRVVREIGQPPAGSCAVPRHVNECWEIIKDLLA